MWLPSYVYYVICPRALKLVDYFSARLRDEFAKELALRGPDAEASRNSPQIEMKVLSSRTIAAASDSQEPKEETIASVTLTDPRSGLVVGTAICIGLASSSGVPDRTRTHPHAPSPRPRPRKLAGGLVPAQLLSSRAGKRALRAAGSRFRQNCSRSLAQTGVLAGARS